MGHPTQRTRSSDKEKISEEGTAYCKTEANIELNKLDETKLSGTQAALGNGSLQEVCLTIPQINGDSSGALPGRNVRS